MPAQRSGTPSGLAVRVDDRERFHFRFDTNGLPEFRF